MPRYLSHLWPGVVILFATANGWTAEPEASRPLDVEHAAKMARGVELFKQQVRPILIGRCLNCHGGESVESELNLTSRELLLKGGAGGAVIVPGRPLESRLYLVAAHLEEPFMPEDGAQLSKIALEQLARWIELGAPYDQPLVPQGQEDPRTWTERRIDDSRRQFWSFQPLAAVQPPSSADSWARTPIDEFVLAKLREKGLRPNAIAERRTLIRRACFDLTGLPPTSEEIDQFIDDASPDAYAKLLDRLLDSPHYGERWGRHWLDIARFAESHGFEQDYDRPHAYHFRDFVIRALNDDMPYDRFVRWQLAGDEIAPENPLAMMATGFLGAGVFPTQLTEKEFESARYDELDDMLATTGTAMLGITIGCARCHDHKFDPIPSGDYYRLLSSFTTAIRGDIELDLDPRATAAALAAWEQEHAPLVAALEALKRDERESSPENEAEQAELQRRLDEHLAAKPKPATVMVVSEGVKPIPHHADDRGFPHFYPETFFLNRGDVNQKQGTAPQGFLQVLMPVSEGAAIADASRWFEPPSKDSTTSHRRHALANWITDHEAGAGHLLARVIANRLWQHHFGRGIVSTPNDFGFQGQRPTHPELLDWLARRLIDNRWRLKPLHKLIMSSAVYMQSSDHDDTRAADDPDNQWLWRRTPRRLEAEIIRDAMLRVSGQLDSTMFGPGTLDESMKRRSIYFMIKRSQLVPMMQVFDAPEPLVGVADRPSTTIAPQALIFMNSPHVRGYSTSFAKRLQAESGDSLEGIVRAGYARAVSRPPSREELADAVQFIAGQRDSYAADENGDAVTWAVADFCHVLFSLNEFVYVD